MLRRLLPLFVSSGLVACAEPGGGSGQNDGTSVPPDGTADTTTLPDTSHDTTTAPDTTGDVPADTEVGPLPDWGDDDALLAWLGAIVQTCPPMSYSTAPGLWEMTLITDYGCTVRHPGEWVTDLQPGYFEATSDARRQVGYAVVGTYLAGTDWDEVSLGDLVVSELQKVYPDLAVLAADSESDPYGFGMRFRVIVMKFTNDGTRSLGVAKVLHGGCSWVLNNCPLTASITWAPAAELPLWACLLGQIEATLRCPSGGGTTCDENDCDATCKAQGGTGGTCVGDSCMCH